MHADTRHYNASQAAVDRQICDLLAEEIERCLPEVENKVWHAHPVWFLVGNPIVGYSKLKDCVRLLFWSGQSFETPGLEKEGTFKAAEAGFTSLEQVDSMQLRKWLSESRAIQWDYKNLSRRKGKLEHLKRAFRRGRAFALETSDHRSPAASFLIFLNPKPHTRKRAALIDRRFGVRYARSMVTLRRSPVHSDPMVMGGTLVFRASRVPAQTLLDYLSDGYSLDEFLEMFPSVDREDAVEFLRLARDEVDADRP